jgi:uncharacterized protein YbcI
LNTADRPAAVLQREPFGGTLRGEISKALAMIYRESFGRGPTSTTTYEFCGGYVTFLGEVLQPHERTLVRTGRADLVVEAWTVIREAGRSSVTAELQRITGHAELRDSFQLQPERDLAIELFWAPGTAADPPAVGGQIIQASTGRSPAHAWPD